MGKSYTDALIAGAGPWQIGRQAHGCVGLRLRPVPVSYRGAGVRWGFGCEIGVYAQHVYTSLPDRQTVLEYLDYNSTPGTTTEQLLRQAGALLFRGGHVKKRISVLSLQ